MLTGEAKRHLGDLPSRLQSRFYGVRNSRQSFTPGASRPNQRKLRSKRARPGSRLGTGRPRLPRVRARFATNANFSPGGPIWWCVARLGLSNTEEKRGSRVAELRRWAHCLGMWREKEMLVGWVLLEPQFGNLGLDYSMNPWKGELYGCGLTDGNLHSGRKFIGNHFLSF